MLDARRLRVLVEVAEQGSFSAAADALCFTQPSISRHVAALERELGVQLIDRDGRPVRLTQAGEVLVAHARAVLGRLDAAKAQVEALTRLEGGRLRLAAFPSANTWLVPEALRCFAGQHPHVELSLGHTSSREHMTALRCAEVDLALLTGWDEPDHDAGDDLELVALLEDPLFVALPRHHHLAGQHEVSLEQLSGETWIEGAHPDCLGMLVELCSARGVEARLGFHCQDWTGKGALVAAGLGLTLYPGLAAVRARDDIVLRRLPDIPARMIYVAYPRAATRAPATEAMVEILRTLAARHGRRMRRLLARPPAVRAAYAMQKRDGSLRNSHCPTQPRPEA